MIYTRATINALQAQIDDLQKRLTESEAERKHLLNCLLTKNHIEPIRESAATAPTLPTIQILSPTNGITPEMEDAVRQDWIAEEAAYIALGSGIDADRALQQAEQEYVRQHQVIN